MNQQSEHLSDAQIERFGQQTSGAGPDDRQHEEDQRVDGHLADCSACRSRLLELQRTYLAVQADPQMNHVSTRDCPAEDDIRKLAAGLCPENVSAKLLHHVSTCDRCGALLKSVSEDLSISEDLSNDFSTEEQEALARLSSATPEWQQLTAQAMLRRAFAAGSDSSTSAAQNISTADDAKQDSAASIADHASRTSKAGAVPGAGTPGVMTPVSAGSTSVTPGSGTREPETPVSGTSGQSGPILVAKRPKTSFIWKWKLVPAAAAACAMIVFGILYTTRDTPEKVEKLLAQAYTEQRTMEMRIPGAEYASPVAKERGTRIKQPPVLFEAKSKILNQLSKKPEDWKWLRQLGVQETIERHYDEAIIDLSHALRIEPGSTATMVDLATAYFQRAQLSQSSSDFRKSVELLGKVLTNEPNNQVALFNRAILYQEMSPPLYDLAIEDWTHYLEIDSSGGWSEEARRHRADLENIKKKPIP